ncbi:MAG: hypothetical protein AB1817_19475 [Chloroflexota bacterium]
MIEAILANVILWIVIASLYGWAINQPSEPDAIPMEDDPPVIVEITVIVTGVPRDTPSPTATVQDTPPPILSAAPPPEPTRREFGEPTKPPYVFPTPIYIPPVPRERPTPTRSK